MSSRDEWICCDPDGFKYERKVSDDTYEFYEIVQVGEDAGDDDFAVVHDTITVNEHDARTSRFIEEYLKPYGYSGIDELRVIYREAWPQSVADCIFETKSCFNSVNYICCGTYEFCEGYLAAKIERRITN